MNDHGSRESKNYWIARRAHLLTQYPNRKVRRALAKCRRVLLNRFGLEDEQLYRKAAA